jgi:hypothetical protein
MLAQSSPPILGGVVADRVVSEKEEFLVYYLEGV